MLFWLGIAFCVGCALSWWVRTGPAAARAANVLAMTAVAVAALAPPLARATWAAAEVQIVTTGPSSTELAARIAELAKTASPRPKVELSAANGSLGLAATRAALRSGPRLEDSAILWTAPFPDRANAPRPMVGSSWTAADAWPFDPHHLCVEFAASPRQQRPLACTLRIDGPASAMHAELSLRGDGWSATAKGNVGDGRRVDLDALPTSAGAATVAVVVDAGDRRIVASGSFEVQPAAGVLVLEPSGAIAAALRAQGVLVAEASTLPADLGAYVAIALGTALPPEDQSRLRAAVEDGLGLFAFGPGIQGDGEPLRECLPVTILPQGGGAGGEGIGSGDGDPSPPVEPPVPERLPPNAEGGVRNDGTPPQLRGAIEVDKHAIAMVLVVDRSSSMGQPVLGGQTKMSYAKTSARETARALGEGDAVGLVTFGDDDQARMEMPLTDASQFGRIEQGIAKLAHATERTFLESGLRVAGGMLDGSKAAVRHIVVLTDGEVWDQEFVLRHRANELRRAGMTLSIISIVDDRTGPDYQGKAELIAREGGGSFLPVRDPRSVPHFVSAEVVRALDRVGRKPMGGDGPSTNPPAEPEPKPKPPMEPPRNRDRSDAGRLAVRAVSASQLLAPSPDKWPDLLRAIENAARASAHVLLVAGDAGQPLLAYGHVGTGRVGVFAADLAGEAAQGFRSEPVFSARISQWIEAVHRAVLAAPSVSHLDARIEPAAPTPDEMATLQSLSGAPAAPVERLRLPPPRVVMEREPQTPDWSFAAIVAVLALAWIEHRGVRRIG